MKKGKSNTWTAPVIAFSCRRELFIPKRIFWITIGTLIVSFGLYNIHGQTNITEGGALGMILLLEHWFHLKASVA